METSTESVKGGGGADESVDRLNAVGILRRREIEARVLAPIIEAVGKEFGRERVVEIVRDAIAGIARSQGQAMAAAREDVSLIGFAGTLEPWTRDDAIEMTVHEATADRLSFDVTRCRYAEMYRALGIADLGAALSCSRDEALIEGFAPDITLTRTDTIMQGASCCTFRYARRK